MAYIEVDGMLKAKNYRFFERSAHVAAGTSACYPIYYKELLKCVCEKVWIWDPYFFNGDESVFDAIPPNVDVRFLYMWNKNIQGAVSPQNVFSKIDGRLALPKGVLEVAFLKVNTALYSERKWHDRFLIIDKSSIFLIGASLMSQRYDAKCFGIYEMNNVDDAGLVMERFEDTWNAAVAAGNIIR